MWLPTVNACAPCCCAIAPPAASVWMRTSSKLVPNAAPTRAATPLGSGVPSPSCCITWTGLLPAPALPSAFFCNAGPAATESAAAAGSAAATSAGSLPVCFHCATPLRTRASRSTISCFASLAVEPV
jgi:hypothetical protein